MSSDMLLKTGQVCVFLRHRYGRTGCHVTPGKVFVCLCDGLCNLVFLLIVIYCTFCLYKLCTVRKVKFVSIVFLVS